MRRKSERNKPKTPPEKKTAESSKKPRRSSRRSRRRSSSRSSNEDSDETPQKPVEVVEKQISPPSDEAKKSGSHSNTDEDNPEQPVWKVKTSDSATGEIQKLKICLQRPPTTPEKTERSPRRRRGKGSSQSDDTSEDRSNKKRSRRGSMSDTSLDNSRTLSEKDECLIIDKETNVAVLGEGKLELSQSGEENESERCVQDSQTRESQPESETAQHCVENKSASSSENTSQVLVVKQENEENTKDETGTDSTAQEVKENLPEILTVDESVKQEEVEVQKEESLENVESVSAVNQNELIDKSGEETESEKTVENKDDVIVKTEEQIVTKEESIQENIPESPKNGDVEIVKEEHIESTKSSENIDIEMTKQDSISEIIKSPENVTKTIERKNDEITESSENVDTENTETIKPEENIEIEMQEKSNEEISEQTTEVESAEQDFKESVDKSSVKTQENSDSDNEAKKSSNGESEKNDSDHDDKSSTSSTKNESSRYQVTEIHYEEEVVERIPRKRKWGKFKAESLVAERITLESIQKLCPSFKMLSEDELKMETEEVVVKEKKVREERKVYVKPPSPKEEETEKEVSRIGLNRKISIVDDEASKLQPPPSPAKNPVSAVLFITNLVRPFTLKHLKEMLSRTGTIIEGGFWTDKIKSKCYVQYTSEEEAEATRNALHGVQWPINGKKLIIDYTTVELMESARNFVVISETPPTEKESNDKIIEKQVSDHENKENEERKRDKTRTSAPIREWDMGKKQERGRSRSRDRDRNREKERDRSRSEKVEKRRHSRNPSPSNGEHLSNRKKKKEEDVPTKLMDDLFHKTKATPSIYWLPLSPDMIAKKQQQRLQRMAEHKRRLEESRRLERDFGGRGAGPGRGRRRGGRFDPD